MAKYQCVVCSYVHMGWKPPSHCPICGVQSNMFKEGEEETADNEKKTDQNRDQTS
jgi:rubredoxin